MNFLFFIFFFQKTLQVLGEDEVVQLLRTSRETVEQLLERSSESVKIGQSECKSVRVSIGVYMVI